MVAAVCAAVLVFAAAVTDVDDEGANKDNKGSKAKVSVVVDLNQATVEELCTLPGIGPKKADAILALRHKKPFTRVTQLLQVKGIGPKTLDKLKPHLRVSLTSPTAPTPPSTTAATTASTQTPLPTLAPLH